MYYDYTNQVADLHSGPVHVRMYILHYNPNNPAGVLDYKWMVSLLFVSCTMTYKEIYMVTYMYM